MAFTVDPHPPLQQAFRTLPELRRQFANAFAPTPWRYWCDFLLSALLGWGAFFVTISISPSSITYLITTLIAIVALLRATIFIHELSHLKRGAVPGLEVMWNLLIGIPFLLPSVMYDSHADHHRQATFATAQDPEYVPLAHWSRFQLFRFVASMLFVPLLLALRWGIAGPLSLFVPPLHRLLISRASSLVINPHYQRPLPHARERIRWYSQEVATALGFWIAVVATANGIIPLRCIGQWYIIGAGIAVLNQLRTLAAHRYTNDGRQLTIGEQLLDSINLTGPSFLTTLAAPVGLRYHAVHHFLPTVPYHSLGTLHRQLCTALAPDSPYHRTEVQGILLAIHQLMQGQSSAVPSTQLTADHPATEV